MNDDRIGETALSPLNQDIEMGGLLNEMIDTECTICFNDMTFQHNSSYGCGNSKCSGKFCDECIESLSDRHIHTNQCCTCTERCGDAYVSRLVKKSVVVFVFDGDHFFLTSAYPLEPPYQVKLISSPIVETELRTFRGAYVRAADIAPNSASIIGLAFSKNTHLIQWIHEADSVRWGKLIHTVSRYTTVHYQMIYMMNMLAAMLTGGIFLMFGDQLFSSDTLVVEFMCMFVNIVMTVASYWMFVLQILYCDIGVISTNIIRFRVLTFGCLSGGIVANNVLMIECTFGNGANVRLFMYLVNSILHGTIAMWMRWLT